LWLLILFGQVVKFAYRLSQKHPIKDFKLKNAKFCFRYTLKEERKKSGVYYRVCFGVHWTSVGGDFFVVMADGDFWLLCLKLQFSAATTPINLYLF
jgi:hypothetical protein